MKEAIQIECLENKVHKSTTTCSSKEHNINCQSINQSLFYHSARQLHTYNIQKYWAIPDCCELMYEHRLYRNSVKSLEDKFVRQHV